MRKLLCSLGIALLLATVDMVPADPALAGIEASAAQPTTPPAVNSRNSAVFLPAAPAHVAPPPAADAPKQAAPGPAAPPTASAATGAAKAGQPGAPDAVEMTKLKHQIKTVRLSLADTQGRLVVTEKDLSTASTENAQLRSDTTNLRVGLAKAETIAKKSEEELGHRRQEAKALQPARPAGSATLVLVLLLCLVITAMLAVVLVGQGRKLRTILDRMHDAKADEARVEQLRAQVKDEQQRAERLEAESQRLKAAAESQAPAPAGSKREKLDHMRRELREAQAAVEAEKRRAAERVQKLEAEMARIGADKQDADERLQKLEPEMVRLVDAKQELLEQVQKLKPEVAELTADKLEAVERSRQLAHDAARLMAEKLRLEHALAKANEKQAFFDQDEPEDTLPPIVG
jgi:chromosome segregation ATPase